MAFVLVTLIVVINLIWSVLILYHLSKFGMGLESRILSIVLLLGLIVFTLTIFLIQGQINLDSLIKQFINT